MKIFKRLSLVLIILLFTAGLLAYFYYQSLKPQYAGELAIQGLEEKVEVVFDEYGVPHIYAKNEHDAYMAFGYVHAQDRLFQMEMLRRLAGGRLAEVLGKDLLGVDKLFRTLGLNRIAAINAEQLLSSDTGAYQKAIHTYLKGVNAFVKNGKTPIEFTIIGIPKMEFRDEDIFLVAGYMAFSFAVALRVDPVFQKIQTQYPGYLEEVIGNAVDIVSPTEMSNRVDGKASPYLNHLISSLHNIVNKIPVPLLNGSNGWVINGEHTKSGKPILANETHIQFAQPAVWYEAHLEYPGFSFYGHHIAGLPFGVLGNNRFCGWGLTMFENDDMDFYLEEKNPDNPNQIRNGDQWKDLDARKETIKIKGEQDTILVVQTTRHGPIVNGIIGDVPTPGPYVSLWWTILQHPYSVVRSFYSLNHAQSFQEAQAAVSAIAAPGLNFMYADTSGNIAWWAAAKLPVRGEQQTRKSRLFLDGANPENDHTQFYSFKNNPHAVNPQLGYVYNGNNQPDSVDGILYPGYFYPKDRVGRIGELLRKKNDWTPAEVSAMQLDNVSITAPSVGKEIASVLQSAGNKSFDPLIEILNGWDGNHNKSSTAPSVYYNLLSHIIFYSMADEIGVTSLKSILNSAALKGSYLYFISNNTARWWDNINTQRKETRQDIFEKAGLKTLSLLKEKCGPTPTDWAWEKIHYLKHKHPLGSIKLLDGIFSVGNFKVDGGSEVINNLMFELDTLGTFEVSVGPALRKVSDFSNLDLGQTVSPTGQSGVPASPFYKDQAQLFAEGKTRPMKMFVDKERKTMILILSPAP